MLSHMQLVIPPVMKVYEGAQEQAAQIAVITLTQLIVVLQLVPLTLLVTVQLLCVSAFLDTPELTV